LIQCLLGLLKRNSGTSTVFGEDSWDLSAKVKNRLGYVPQVAQFYPWLVVKDVIEYWGAFYSNWDQDLADKWMRRWELPAYQKAGKLSPGQTQRLALLVAFAHRPELLILDEPVSSLDPIGRREILKELIELTQDGEHTVLFSSHILSDLERIASHVAILANKRLACFEELDQLKDRFKRVRLRSRKVLPESFSVAEAIHTNVQGRNATLIVPGINDALIAKLQGDWDGEASVEDLNLEEIFIEFGNRGGVGAK
jgi:ABC-2 type transport system ATP-binding protein